MIFPKIAFFALVIALFNRARSDNVSTDIDCSDKVNAEEAVCICRVAMNHSLDICQMLFAQNSNGDVSVNIINGVQVESGVYPWFARMTLGSGWGGCGGSLVTSDYVLTAAHCVEGRTGSLVRRGGFQIGALCAPYGPSSSSNCGQDVESIGIDDIIIHPDYDNLSYDFALVRLDKSSLVTPVDMDPGNISPGYENVSLKDHLWPAGFGTDENGQVTSNLMHVDVNYVKQNVCNNNYSGSVEANMMCAADTNQDSCQGDSGGPLYDSDNKVLVGIVSWGIGCADSRYPGVYSRISHQIEWIQDVICDDHSNPKPSFCTTSSPVSSPTTSAPVSSPPTSAPVSSPPTSAPVSSPTSSAPVSSPTTRAPTSNEPLPLSWLINFESSGVEQGIIAVEYKISNRMYGLDVFEEDCENLLPDGLLQVSTSHNDISGGFTELRVEVELNQTAIEDDETIWKPDADGVGGSFKFCLSTSLYKGDIKDDDHRVTRKDVLFDVSVNNVVSFSEGGITVEAEELEEANLSIDFQGEIDVYQCDDRGEEIDADPIGPFDLLNVCVKVKDSESMKVTDFVNFSVKQGTFVFAAIQNGIIDDLDEDVVTKVCGVDFCRVSMQPVAAFFAEPNELTVYGEVRVGGAQSRIVEQKEFNLTVMLVQEPCKESTSLMKTLSRVLNE